MALIWQILIQFIFRLAFGLGLAMAVTPPRWVTSGFYRVHLWVLMGLSTFAALALYTNGEALASSLAENWRWLLALAIVTGVLSYVGSVIWLYEKRSAGRVLLYAVSLVALLGAVLATPREQAAGLAGGSLALLDLLSGGLLLGLTMAAMLLGHWYLNTPGMPLAPLKRLVVLMGAAVVLRAGLCGVGLALEVALAVPPQTSWWLFLLLRWLAGLVGTFGLVVLTWKTLQVPNTQSATGILYAALILVFIGELTSQLLSVEASYPL